MIENVEKNLVSLMQKLVDEDDEDTQNQYLLSIARVFAIYSSHAWLWRDQKRDLFQIAKGLPKKYYDEFKNAFESIAKDLQSDDAKYEQQICVVRVIAEMLMFMQTFKLPNFLKDSEKILRQLKEIVNFRKKKEQKATMPSLSLQDTVTLEFQESLTKIQDVQRSIENWVKNREQNKGPE